MLHPVELLRIMGGEGDSLFAAAINKYLIRSLFPPWNSPNDFTALTYFSLRHPYLRHP